MLERADTPEAIGLNRRASALLDQSDADGKFSFAYPCDKALTIFPRAQRGVLNKTEQYYWLVNAPTNSVPAQVFLSNNNLVFVDQDGYFKLKPKRGP